MNKYIESWFLKQEDYLSALSRELWENPELSEHEKFAEALLTEELEKKGFTVTRGVGDLPTAFEARWGHGDPVIGFLAEYDALPGLSQGSSPQYAPIEGQELGHGCGHNLLGVGAVGAGMAVKEALEAMKLPGTVVVYGCPSEEIMLGKIEMTKQGVFNGLDAAISWHPGDMNNASEQSYQAMLSLDFHFTGQASHAAMAPEKGASALDAVELMNVGANYLREHIPVGGQMHYAITHGGDKPNIVPDKASVWYFIRANSTADVMRIYHRLCDIAKGATLMTGTHVTHSIRTGCNETIIVPEFVEVMNRVMEEAVPHPVWTAEEEDFARQLLVNMGADFEALAAKFGGDVRPRPLHDGTIPPTGKTIDILGSSDLSDVSWVVPTVMLFAACYPKGTPNHSWGVTACTGNSIGQRGMIYAAKVMAETGLALFESQDTLDKIKASYRQVMGERSYRPAAEVEGR